MGFTCILQTNIVLVGRYWDFNRLRQILDSPKLKSLHITILNLMKMVKSLPKGWKTMGKVKIARYE